MASSMGFDIFARDHASKTFDKVGDSAQRLEKRLDGIGKSGTGLRGQLDGASKSVAGAGSALESLGGRAAGLASTLASTGASFAASALKLAVLGGAMASTASSAAGLVAALAPASGAIAALPGALALGAAAFATLKLAMSGVGDAFGAALTGDALEFLDAVAGMPAEVERFAYALRALKPAIDSLRISVQNRFFGPMVEDLQATGRLLLDVVKPGMVEVAGEFGRLGAGVLEFGRSASAISLVRNSFETLRQILSDIETGTLRDLLAAMAYFAKSTLPAFDGLGASVNRLAERFSVWLTTAAASGAALEWISNAGDVFRQLGTILADVGGIISGVFSAIETSGTGTLGVLGQLVDAAHAWVDSAQGQDVLVTVFKALNDVGQALMPVLSALGAAVAAIAPEAAKVATALGPVLAGAIDALGAGIAALGPGLVQLVEGLGRAVAGIGPLLEPLGRELGTVFAELGNALALIVPELGKIALALAPALAAAVRALGPALAALGPGLVAIAENLAAAFASAPVQNGLLALGKALSDLVIAAAPLIPHLTQIAGILLQVLGGAVTNLSVALGPLIAALGQALEPALVAISDALAILIPHMEPVYKAFGEIGAALITQLLPPFLDLIPVMINSLIPAFAQLARDIEPLIPLLADLAVKFIQEFLPALLPMVPELSRLSLEITRMGLVLAQLVAEIGPYIEQIIAVFERLYVVLVGNSIIPDLINEMTRWFRDGVQWIKDIVSWFGELPAMIGSWLGDVVNWVETRWDTIKNYIGTKIDEIKTNLSDTLEQIRTKWNDIWDGLKTFVTDKFNEIKTAISGKIDEVLGFFRDLPGRIQGAMGNLGSLLWDSGRSIVQGLIDGLYSKLQDAYNAASDILGQIRNLFPFSPAKEGPFSGRGWTLFSGQSIAEGFAKGMLGGERMVAKAAAGLVGAASMSLTPSINGRAQTALPLMPQTGGLTIHLHFSGQPLVNRDEIYRMLISALNEAKGRGFNLGAVGA